MSDAWRVATIESFQQVPVAPATVLLRVTAVSAFRPLGEDGRPTLVADNGREVLRFAAIPAPADEGRLLRCAFSVPATVVAVETVFSLEFDDSHVIALPAPSGGAARLVRRPQAPEAVAGTPPAETEERRSELAPKLTELSEELASARREAGDLRDDAELGRGAQARILHLHLEAVETRAELQALRDLATLSASELSAERAGHLELRERFVELETWNAELERRLADTTTQLAGASPAAQPASQLGSPEVVPEEPEPEPEVEVEVEPAPEAGRRAIDDTELAEISRAAAAEAHRTAERDLDDTELAEISRAAAAEAHRTAERDLDDAASSTRS